MLKQILSVFLIGVMLLPVFAGCTAGLEQASNTNDAQLFGDIENKDPLRICVDIQNFAVSDPTVLDTAIEDFLSSLKQNTGLDNVVIEYIPGPYSGLYNSGEESDETLIRETMVDRIRVEILSGGGPDVFVMTQMGTYQSQEVNSLFPFPQKVMESDVFLPLDKYMKKAEFAEWDKFPEAVMDAGRNAEGHQIIPLIYTLPAICYPLMDFEYTPNRQLSWNDMLNDPELAPYAAELANCCDVEVDSATQENVKIYNSYLEFVLGELADFESEELLFTEEELLQRVHQILALESEDTNGNGAEEMFIGWKMNSDEYPNPVTIIPMYSDDGGVTARIDSYAAVNRNTQKPEEAFTVIDYLLDDQVQSASEIYLQFLYSFDGVPMHEDLFQENMPLYNNQYYLLDENYEELCEVREQITVANFHSSVSGILNDTLQRCVIAEALDTTVEEIVHEAYENMQRRVRE